MSGLVGNSRRHILSCHGSYALMGKYGKLSLNYHQIPTLSLNNHQIPTLSLNYHQIPTLSLNYHQIPTLTLNYHQIPTLSVSMNLSHDKIWAASWQNQQNDLCTLRRLRSVWLESLLCVQWVAKDPRLLHAETKDSDQTGRMPRLIWVFAGRKGYFVGFVMRQLNYAKLLNGLSPCLNLIF